MKSVCILLHNYYDFDIRVRRKAEALISAGYQVDVLALRSPKGQKNYCLKGVNVRTISLGKKRGSPARYAFEYAAFFCWAFVRATLQHLSRRYDVVDVNTLPDFLVFAAVGAKWMGAKVVLDMHEMTPEFYMSKYGISEDSWWVRFLKLQEKMSFDCADYVITINEPIEDLFVGRGLLRGKSTIITNSADEARFRSYSESTAADAAATPGKFVMMYHGTLTRLYGLDVAVEAFALAHQEMPQAEFWILGDGPDAKALQALVQRRGLESKVRFFGLVSPVEIPAWLSKCDAGILPMRRDVFLDLASPNKLTEFIVMGKAVVISRLKAIRHSFSEDALAYYEPGDPNDMAKQMIRVYGDRDLRVRLAARAKEEYAPISWEVMKQRYLALMEGIVSPAGRATEQSSEPEMTGVGRQP